MCCTGSLGEEQEVQVFLSMSLQVKFIIVVMYETKLYFSRFAEVHPHCNRKICPYNMLSLCSCKKANECKTGVVDKLKEVMDLVEEGTKDLMTEKNK